jgi:hypothetical protein
VPKESRDDFESRLSTVQLQLYQRLCTMNQKHLPPSVIFCNHFSPRINVLMLE